MHRFTPRKADSTWSVVNTKRMKALAALGRVSPAGAAVFERRDRKKTGRYSYERKNAAFDPALEKTFKADAKAWTFFRAQAPWYQRLIIHKIVSPKQVATRERWLQRVIAASAAGRRIDDWPPASATKISSMSR